MTGHLFFGTILSSLAALISFSNAPGLMAQTPISLNERIAQSELIVVGQVQNIESRWDENKAQIWTYVTISVEEFLKGSAPNSSIMVKIPGGAIKEDRIGGFMEGMPSFSHNEKVLVMLKLSTVKPYYYVVDTPRGKYSISPYGNVVGLQKTSREFIREIENILASERGKS
jgi:hypothetical protein